MDTDQVKGYLDKKRAGEKRIKKTYFSFIKLEDGKLVEQVVNPDPSFVVYDPKTDSYSFQPTVQFNKKYLYPLEGDLVTKHVIRFPRKLEEYGDSESLRQEIKQFIHRYVDIHPFYEEIASYYVLLTWLFDKNTAITYLGIYGEFGSGKTRAAITIGSLCYKPAMVSGSLTCSPIYRILEQARGTLIVNEFDFKDSDLGSELIKILNNGYEKGLYVLRTEPKTGKTEAFDAFSPKIFTFRKKKNDQAFESRLVTIQIEETMREDIPILLPLSFEEEAAVIRDKLLLFRFRNYYNETKVDSSIFIGLERRFRQTLYPLFTVINDPIFLEKLKSFTHEFQQQQRVDRGMSWVGEHLQNLITITCNQTSSITIQQLANKYNENKDTKDRITAKKAGSIVRNEFKLKTERITSGEKKGQYSVILNREKIQTLCLRFNIEIPEQSSLHSPSSPQSQPQSEDGEQSEDSTDIKSVSVLSTTQVNIPSSHENLKLKEKQARNKLGTLYKESPEYAELYSVWFALRTEGEKLGLWDFVPSPGE